MVYVVSQKGNNTLAVPSSLLQVWNLQYMTGNLRGKEFSALLTWRSIQSLYLPFPPSQETEKPSSLFSQKKVFPIPLEEDFWDCLNSFLEN